MKNPKRTTIPLLVGTLVVIVIIFINTASGSFGGEGEMREYAELEQALMQMEGVGEVIVYFHYGQGASQDPLSDLLTSRTSKTGGTLQGIFVVAEGAGDIHLRNRLVRILSSVLQLPEHRIVIEEMKKRGTQNESE